MHQFKTKIGAQIFVFLRAAYFKLSSILEKMNIIARFFGENYSSGVQTQPTQKCMSPRVRI